MMFKWLYADSLCGVIGSVKGSKISDRIKLLLVYVRFRPQEIQKW